MRVLPSLLDKLEREVKLQQASYEEITKRMEYNKGPFRAYPRDQADGAGRYSVNGFGMRIHPVLHVYRMHEGVDIISDVGTNVYAAGDGIVHFSGRTAGGYGMVIEVTTVTAIPRCTPTSRRSWCARGRPCKRGELIAKSGRSGLVSGPHLHYEVRYRGGSRTRSTISSMISMRPATARSWRVPR